jgi:heptosyltransferase III
LRDAPAARPLRLASVLCEFVKERGNSTLHFFDRYAGIPAVAILGSLKAKRTLPSPIQTLGLLKLGAIGDTILISAMIADLRAAFPEVSITFFAGKSNLELVQMLDGIERVIMVPTHNLSAGIKTVRSCPVDVLFDFGQWSRLEALLSIFSRASFTIGFRTCGQHRHFGYDRAVNHSFELHELDNIRLLGHCLGVETRSLPFLKPPESRRTDAHQYVVFHLWPGGRRKSLKEWPRERWLRLIEEFAGLERSVVLTGSPSDRERNAGLIASTPPAAREFVVNAAGCSLKESADLLAHAMLVVSVDTGLMHMAAALGVPLVALHGPTASKRWGPVGSDTTVVETTVGGCGYINLGWESQPLPPSCMEGICYEAVRDACRNILERPTNVSKNGLSGVRYAVSENV